MLTQFSKLPLQATFTVDNIQYRKTCTVSGESVGHIRLFGQNDAVIAAAL